ncbi:MAG: hypothetical protein K5979_05890 [Ruminococcus sp.]|nr:hypothetical protein [Ruminococcus sp.]
MKKISITAAAVIMMCTILTGCSSAGRSTESPDNEPLSGGWEMIVNPELSGSDRKDTSEKVYYTFSEPGQYGDGEYQTIFDGGIEKGAYKLSEKDGKCFVNMGTADLECRIEGAELTLTYPESTDEQTGEMIPAADYIFTRAKAPEYETESYDTFETDEKLIASWTTEERTLSYYADELHYTETVTFLESGVMVIHYLSEDLALDRSMYYSYTTADGTLTFSLVTDKETLNQVDYTFDADGDLQFLNDETASSIFADAFFSDVTYYLTKG